MSSPSSIVEYISDSSTYPSIFFLQSSNRGGGGKSRNSMEGGSHLLRFTSSNHHPDNCMLSVQGNNSHIPLLFCSRLLLLLLLRGRHLLACYKMTLRNDCPPSKSIILFIDRVSSFRPRRCILLRLMPVHKLPPAKRAGEEEGE